MNKIVKKLNNCEDIVATASIYNDVVSSDATMASCDYHAADYKDLLYREMPCVHQSHRVVYSAVVATPCGGRDIKVRNVGPEIINTLASIRTIWGCTACCCI